MVMGFLIQAAGGKFDNAFLFLIAGAIASSVVALTVKEVQRSAVAVPG
jgi:hypothetical protein